MSKSTEKIQRSTKFQIQPEEFRKEKVAKNQGVTRRSVVNYSHIIERTTRLM
jgi:hypothetical protein